MTTPKIEFNVGAILQALILAALLWVGTSINTLNAQMAAVQVHVVDFADTKRRTAALEVEAAKGATERAALANRVSQLERSR